MCKKLFYSIILVCFIMLSLCACTDKKIENTTSISSSATHEDNPTVSANSTLVNKVNFDICVRRVELPQKADGNLFLCISEDGKISYCNKNGIVVIQDCVLYNFVENGYIVQSIANGVAVSNVAGENVTVEKQENEMIGDIIEKDGKSFLEIFALNTQGAEFYQKIGCYYLVDYMGSRFLTDQSGQNVLECEYENYEFLADDTVFGWTYGSDHSKDCKAFIDMKTQTTYSVDSRYVIWPTWNTWYGSPLYSFEEGVVPFCDAPDGKETLWGYVNLKGEVVISPTFYYVEAFYEGTAVALYQNGKNTEVGYIGTDGSPLFEKHFAVANNFSEGLALASVDGEKYGYIDKTGEFVIEPMYDLGALSIVLEDDGADAYSYFHNGYAMVANAEEGWAAYIDKTGKEVFRFSVPVSTEE